MKKITLIIACIMSLNAFAHARKMVVAIGKFKNKSEGKNKNFLALIDRITNGIVNTRKFVVVDNARLKEALDEQKKIDMGMSDAKGTPKMGKFKTAGYVIYGTVLSMGGVTKSSELYGIRNRKATITVELNVRFMDAETGELLASKIVKAERSYTDQLTGSQKVQGTLASPVAQKAIQAAADKVVSQLMELAYPTVILKVGGSKVYVNLPEERAKKGDLLQVFSVGEDLTDPDTGESLGRSEELLGEIKIARTSPKYSIAVPVAPLTTTKLTKGMIVRPISAQELEERQTQTAKQSTKRFRKRF